MNMYFPQRTPVLLWIGLYLSRGASASHFISSFCFDREGTNNLRIWFDTFPWVLIPVYIFCDSYSGPWSCWQLLISKGMRSVQRPSWSFPSYPSLSAPSTSLKPLCFWSSPSMSGFLSCSPLPSFRMPLPRWEPSTSLLWRLCSHVLLCDNLSGLRKSSIHGTLSPSSHPKAVTCQAYLPHLKNAHWGQIQTSL